MLVGGLLSLSIPAFAANLPNYDITIHRTRLIHGASTTDATQFYSDIPVYIQIPAGTTSSSTPNVIGSTAYQYTYSSSGQGYLSALTIPNLTAKQVASDAGTQGYVIQSAQYAQKELVINAGTSSSYNYASGQSSLSTGPVVNASPDGSQYQAMGIGKYLYTWAQSSYGIGTHAYIYGNQNNSDYQVDDSPLITPPVTVQGAGGSTWTSPVAVIGSWDGGVVTTPTNVPNGDIPITEHYSSSQNNQYPHTTANITSDPTWVGSVPGLGSDCVAFGLDGAAHPRVILFNVTTGKYKAIGVGQIHAGIPDVTVFDAATGTLYVQDMYGGLYAFSLNGTLQHEYLAASWTNNTPIIGQDMALDGSTLYAIGGGGSTLGAFSLNLSLEHSSSNYGSDLSSPSVLTTPGGQNLLVVSNEEGDVYLENTGSVFTTQADQNNQAIGLSPSPPWVGYMPDAGTYHDLIGWTNDDPDHDPALVLYVPEPYHINASFNQAGPLTAITISNGKNVTIYGNPGPTSVTWDNMHNYHSPNMEAVITNAAGNAVTTPDDMTHIGSGQWAVSWTPPLVTGSKAVTYTIVVNGWNELGEEASSTPMTLTVSPTPPSGNQSSNGNGELTLTCGYGAGGLPITVSHTCTEGSDQGNSPSWFADNPTIGLKFGDTIQANLKVPTPNPLDLHDYHITDVQLHATIKHIEGTPNLPGEPNYNASSSALYTYLPVTTTMVSTGTYTATTHILESWAGYPPPQPLGSIVQQGTLTANWNMTVDYSYEIQQQSCSTQDKKRVCHLIWVPESGSFSESGHGTAPYTINGSDYYTISTPIALGN